MIYTEKTYKHLLFCGDIHDNYDAIPNFIRDRGLDTCAVFQVGDFGIGFENRIRRFVFAPELRYSLGLLNISENPSLQGLHFNKISLVFNFKL